MAGDNPMRVAYADPPYLGQCGQYQHFHGTDNDDGFGGCWNDPATHVALVAYLVREFPDGWALSCSTPSLATLLPMMPERHRIASWVKTFCAFKKGVRPCYSWEPVVFVGGRNPGYGHPHAPPEKDGKQNTPKDFMLSELSEDEWNVLAAPITLKKGLTGAKPEAFCSWVLDLLNVQPGDTVVDVFSGTGVMGRIAEERVA